VIAVLLVVAVEAEAEEVIVLLQGTALLQATVLLQVVVVEAVALL